MKKLFRILALVVLTALLLDTFYFKKLNLFEGDSHELVCCETQVDGPFVLNLNKDSVELINTIVSKDTVIVNRAMQSRKSSFDCIVDNESNDKFTVSLMDSIVIKDAIYKKVNKIFVMSDLHGSFNAMYSLLLNNGVIDKEYNWIFGNGHLVMVGDITDRGLNTLPCLWLFYHLDQIAPTKVHYLFGNHELMTLNGRASYLNDKTQRSLLALSEQGDKSESLKYLFSKQSELGVWLRARNTIEKIGDILFVHAGLSKELMDSGLSIAQINNVMREYADISSKDVPKTAIIPKMLLGRYGPVWYRGMMMDYKDYYKKMEQSVFDVVIKHFDAKKVIVGHTEVDEVTTDYQGKLVSVNVHQPSIKNSKQAQALLILGDSYYRVNGKGERVTQIN